MLYLRSGRGGGRPHIVQERQALPVFSQRRQIQPRADDAFFLAGLGEDVALRVNEQRASGVEVEWIASDAVDADDVGLVLYRARLEEPNPMVDALVRPACDDDEQLRAVRRGCFAKEFGEAQVVADEW